MAAEEDIKSAAAAVFGLGIIKTEYKRAQRRAVQPLRNTILQNAAFGKNINAVFLMYAFAGNNQDTAAVLQIAVLNEILHFFPSLVFFQAV